MRVLVVYVRHVSAAVKNPELEMIVYVTVIDVRRIVGKEGLGSLHLWCHRIWETGIRSGARARRFSEISRGLTWTLEFSLRRHVIRVSRLIHQHRRVAHGPRAEEELFKLTINTIGHRSDANSISVDFRSDAACAVVDGKSILAGDQCV